MRVALDTNLLVYAEGVNGSEKKKQSLAILERLPNDSVVLPIQALGELFHVLVRKAGRSPAKARTAILEWKDLYPTVDTSSSVMLVAAELATNHHLGIWDAVMLSAAAEANCRLLLTEDLHSGFTWNGVTISSPFANPMHPLLDSLLSGNPSQ